MTESHEPLDLATLAGMLTFISPNLVRDDWVRVLMGVKSEFGENGKPIAQEWSATASNYDFKAFNATWKSIKAGGRVTIASLVLEAQKNGFKFAPITPADKKRLKAEYKARKLANEQAANEEQARKLEAYKAAKVRAQEILNRASYASHLHPYFIKKGINEDVKHLFPVFMSGGALVIPVLKLNTIFKQNQFNEYDHKQRFELTSLQFIEPTGSKLFLKGGELKGGFYTVRFEGYVNEIVICEGFATGVTLATRYAPLAEVVCAFNANNLKAVAVAFKKQFPTARIIIAADNDRETEIKIGVNVGIKNATEAAQAVDGALWIPEFSPFEEGSDWNDRYLLDQVNQAAPMEAVGGEL